MTYERMRVHLEYREFKADLEGSPEEVSEATIDFLSKVVPPLRIVGNLVFSPDISGYAESLAGNVEFDSGKILLLRREELSAEEAILISLLGLYVSTRLKVTAKDSMSAKELSSVTAKALRTVSNNLALMVDESSVERAERGEYRITGQGMKKASETLERRKETE